MNTDDPVTVEVFSRERPRKEGDPMILHLRVRLNWVAMWKWMAQRLGNNRPHEDDVNRP